MRLLQTTSAAPGRALDAGNLQFYTHTAVEYPTFGAVHRDPLTVQIGHKGPCYRAGSWSAEASNEKRTKFRATLSMVLCLSYLLHSLLDLGPLEDSSQQPRKSYMKRTFSVAARERKMTLDSINTFISCPSFWRCVHALVLIS